MKQNSILHTTNKPLAVLIDPDKMALEALPAFMIKVNRSKATHIFVGGSVVENGATQQLVALLKTLTTLPVVIFPGDVSQITADADAILFLSLISGRHPEYLIGKHVEAVSKLNNTNLEVIPTGYILVENGKETSVQKVTGTRPMSRGNINLIANTAKAGEYLGMQMIYLEAGSGAKHPVGAKIIKAVKNIVQIPVIVGGGIRSLEQVEEAYNAGAWMVVIGTAFEEDESFFSTLT